MKIGMLSVVCLVVGITPALAQDNPQVYRPGNGIVSPTLIKEVKPVYPVEAMRADITGMVQLDCVVLADGTVGEARVIRPLEPSIDAEAVRVAKQWLFRPGTKDGTPVPVRVIIELTFNTSKGPRLGSTDVFRPGAGVTEPKLLQEVHPGYTADARRAGIQGNVQMECVVLPDGTVGDVKVTKPLDPDLDAEAVRTLKRWRFAAGQKDGRSVPVQVEVEMTFSLR